MRSYDQHCPIAKALDVVGDRWTLLIVRELALQGGCRFTDLKNGLPGIATNLLSTRIKELERAGVIRKQMAPPPVATPLLHLTDRGKALEPVLEALGRWGMPLLDGHRDDDVVRPSWFAYPVSWFLTDTEPDQPPASIQLHADGQAMVLDIRGGKVHARTGTTGNPTLTLTGTPEIVVAVLSGRLALADAQHTGLHVTGTPALLDRLQWNEDAPSVAGQGRGADQGARAASQASR